ncbi:MAG: hypothetical protein KGS61_17130, partial [Verrucomicrobia bacterium]|nr:hypothetical protein [Verrucomicrobiota bacterium]
ASEIYERAGEIHRAGQLDSAVAEYRKALAVDCRFHPAWYSQGCAFEAKGNAVAAMACFRQAVALAPDHRESHHNLGKALFTLGLVDEALDSFQSSIALGGGFLPRTAVAVAIPGSPRAGNQDILAARRGWSETHLPPSPPGRQTRSPRGSDRRLRVGYLSSFFAGHNWMKPVWGLVNRHNRERVEIHLFSDAPEDQCRSGYQRHPTDHFHDISGLSNHAAARRIQEAGLDLLVELNGYSRVERLAVAALKPAPLLAGWFGLYGTSGIAAYDYLIGDDQAIPPAEQSCYSEKVLRVPGSYLTFEVSHPVPEVTEPPGLSTGQFTFGCLASSYKLTPPVVEAWSRILSRCPAARLFLKNSGLNCPEAREFLAQRFARCGVSPHRLIMDGPAQHLDFLAAYRHVDLALDPFPYNGATTTMEALWQGVPVLAFSGDRWAARQSASILHAAGLAEFVADSVEDYVERAIARAHAPDALPHLAEFRRGLRRHLTGASICDTTAFARNMEALYEGMLARKV